MNDKTLIGRFDGRVNTKYQIAIPKEFRNLLGATLILTKGLGKYLLVVAENSWKTLLEGTGDKPFINKSARETQRFIFGNAVVVSLDAQGRCVIPEYLREYAGIKTDIVFAGIKRYVEVWDKQDWEDQQKQLAENIESITERLSSLERNDE